MLLWRGILSFDGSLPWRQRGRNFVRSFPQGVDVGATVPSLLPKELVEVRRLRSLRQDFLSITRLRSILIWHPGDLVSRSLNVAVIPLSQIIRRPKVDHWERSQSYRIESADAVASIQGRRPVAVDYLAVRQGG